MNEPVVVSRGTFQEAWIEAVRQLARRGWDLYNLVIHIEDPGVLDPVIHDRLCDFALQEGLLAPKDVAYTIFPHHLYVAHNSGPDLIDAYNRDGGLYERLLHRSHHNWGTYFRRMTHYATAAGVVNQLDRIVGAINARSNVQKAAYTMTLPIPGGETTRPRGGPCLSYVAVQLAPGTPRRLGLLCVYRNHDFRERAYGNYWGLCNLLGFLSTETGSAPGQLTCVSSHATVDGPRTGLAALMEELP